MTEPRQCYIRHRNGVLELLMDKTTMAGGPWMTSDTAQWTGHRAPGSRKNKQHDINLGAAAGMTCHISSLIIGQQHKGGMNHNKEHSEWLLVFRSE